MAPVRRHRHARFRTRGILAFAFILMLVLAGCGGTDDPEGAADTADADTAATEDAAADTDTDTEAAQSDATEEATGDAAAMPELEEQSLVVGGSGSGGGAFIAGGTIAEWVNEGSQLEALEMTNQATGGFVENIRLLASGELDLGMVSTNLMSNALQSTKAFEGESGFEDIRILFSIWPQYGVMGTFDDSIQAVEDLEGRPVNVGPGGSATQEVSRALLQGAGIMETVQMDTQDWAEGVRLMQDGLVDAFGIMGPAPFPAVQEAAAAPGENFRLIDTSSAAEGALELFPEFIAIEVPPDAHGEGLPGEPMPTIGAVGYLATTAELSDDTAYALVQSMLSDEGLEYLQNGYAGFDFTILPALSYLESLVENDVVVPLHPGAIRYWEEQGETVPEALVPDGA